MSPLDISIFFKNSLYVRFCWFASFLYITKPLLLSDRLYSNVSIMAGLVVRPPFMFIIAKEKLLLLL